MRLYGTVTSPYVRRVRIWAAELGVEISMVNTAEPEGQAEMRTHNPLWKVPTAVVGDETILETARIVDRMLIDEGRELPASPWGPWGETNARAVVDGALDAAINVFYLGRDGVTDDASYFAKQRGRVAAAMEWLESRVEGLDDAPDAVLPSRFMVALYTTTDWMVFRDAYDITAHPRIAALREAWISRPSFAATHPTQPVG